MAAKYVEWLKEENLLRVQGWARDGLADTDIAKNMRIGITAFKEWKKKFPEFSEALRIGKDSADRIIENALFKSATGYKVKIEKPVKVKVVEYDPTTGQKTSEKEKLEMVEEEVYIAPNVTAQIFWLKNRKPEQWRDRQEVTDTTALEKLDAILAENIKAAKKAEPKKPAEAEKKD